MIATNYQIQHNIFLPRSFACSGRSVDIERRDFDLTAQSKGLTQSSTVSRDSPLHQIFSAVSRRSITYFSLIFQFLRGSIPGLLRRFSVLPGGIFPEPRMNCSDSHRTVSNQITISSFFGLIRCHIGSVAQYGRTHSGHITCLSSHDLVDEPHAEAESSGIRPNDVHE
jgi:hypothetical protein